eukprot:1159413-Pelagomonas_calceolata.AAC.3
MPIFRTSTLQAAHTASHAPLGQLGVKVIGQGGARQGETARVRSRAEGWRDEPCCWRLQLPACTKGTHLTHTWSHNFDKAKGDRRIQLRTAIPWHSTRRDACSPAIG